MRTSKVCWAPPARGWARTSRLDIFMILPPYRSSCSLEQSPMEAVALAINIERRRWCARQHGDGVPHGRGSRSPPIVNERQAANVERIVAETIANSSLPGAWRGARHLPDEEGTRS